MRLYGHGTDKGGDFWIELIDDNRLVHNDVTQAENACCRCAFHKTKKCTTIVDGLTLDRNEELAPVDVCMMLDDDLDLAGNSEQCAIFLYDDHKKVG